jgi:hypothetical protein
MSGTFRGVPDVIGFNRSLGGGRNSVQHGDRRLPMINLQQEDGIPSRLVFENDQIVGWDHVQYLGELMVH